MTLLLTLIQTSGRSSPILEDAFLCVGAMASTLEGDFQKYAEAFMPFLSNGLQAHEEYSLCGIAVGLVGDICRALGEQALPYAQGFMEALMGSLSSSVLHRSVKPPILSCFGDIAMAVGSNGFDPYLQTTMNVLAQAGSMRADPTNYDIVEYVNTLREGILEAYTGIVSAYKQTPKCKSPLRFVLSSKGMHANRLLHSLSIIAQVLLPYAPSIFAFLNLALVDPDRTEAIVRSAVGLIGDLASEFQKGEIKQELQQEWVSESIKSARTRSGNAETKQVAKWAREMVKFATR